MGAAEFEQALSVRGQSPNGDEERYADKIASFTKGLRHDDLGHVEPGAYRMLLHALRAGDHDHFESVPLAGELKLVNPQAAFTFALEGPDSHQLSVPAPPAFNSAVRAAEMAEVYWQALTRDVPFADYESDPLIDAAANDLSALPGFTGPRSGAHVTPTVLFRGDTPGDRIGPYLSQFLYKDIPYGATILRQTYRSVAAGTEFLTSYDEWLAVQRGTVPSAVARDVAAGYIVTGRDLAEYVHRDFTYQAFLNAALILLEWPEAADTTNPYLGSAAQAGFVTFGGAHVLDLVARVANLALMATWYQKWVVHRTLRPEAFGGRVHNHLTGMARYPVHPDLVRGSDVPRRVFSRYGSYLLPLAYPEGSPAHPSYPAGHATIAGACTTVLKAVFDESLLIPDPVEAARNGGSLEPYRGRPLSVGGELNKLASNVAIGRNTAGVHYRSDCVAGLLLGETVALRLLAELCPTYTEPFDGYSLTRFDGTTAIVGKR